MAGVVADTHAAIWHTVEPDRLSAKARASLCAAAAAGDPVYLATISLVEVCYLVEKKKLSQTVLDRLNQTLADPAAALKLVPLDHAIAKAVSQISRDTVPDMPDRIIAATALVLNLPLVSRDRKIQASAITTIW